MLMKIVGAIVIAGAAWLLLSRGGLKRGRAPVKKRAVDLVPCPSCGAYVEMGALCACSSSPER